VRSNSRSLSIWRCQTSSERAVTEEYMCEIWTVVQTLFSNGSGIEATRGRGLQVMRARVRDGSRLAGLMLSEVTDFRERYKAAILAIQKVDGQVHTESFSTVLLDVGDVLVLQVAEDSPLLESPPQDCQVQESRRSSISLFKRMSQTKQSNVEVSQSPMSDIDVDVEDADVTKEKLAAWNDLEATKTQTDGVSGGVKREFLTAMAIADGSGLAGRTVAQAGIDKLPGTFLVSIDRPYVIPESHPPVDSFKTIPLTEALEVGDVLWFSGAAGDVGDLRKIPGLILYDSGEVNKMNEKVQNRRLVEAVVSRNGSLVGKTAKDVKFRANYGAAVIAVSREGKRVHELPGNIKFHAGDVLLLEAGKTFMDANKKSQYDAFTLISVVEDSSPPRFRMLFPAVFLTVAAYVCYMVKWPVPTLFGTAMVAAILMVMLGVLSEAEARAAIRWEIYLTIAPAFGVGQALINSGVAGTMANFFVNVSEKMNIGDAGLLGAIYFSTVLMSQVVANNAAAALVFPIAMDAAEKVGIDLEVMAFAIMLAASAAFMTPFGYQTNLMVMGPGGYSTGDFLILGTPMQLVLTVVTTISLVNPTRWYLVWLASLAVLICVSLFRYLSERKRSPGKRN
jgi:Trk K+ transport system NAD-binding subunit